MEIWNAFDQICFSRLDRISVTDFLSLIDVNGLGDGYACGCKLNLLADIVLVKNLALSYLFSFGIQPVLNF